MYKKKKAIFQRWRGSYIAISSEIDAIIQGQLPVSSENRLVEDLNERRHWRLRRIIPSTLSFIKGAMPKYSAIPTSTMIFFNQKRY
jgi:hypothetical protein